MQATAPVSTPTKILREPAVEALVPVHATTRWRWERAGKFPKRVKLGPNSVGWFEHEILAWLAARAEGR